MIRRTHLSLGLAFTLVLGGLAVPTAASAAIPATLFQADLSGSVTFQNTESGPDDNWTTTATFPLNATTKAGSPGGSADPAQSDVWIATGSSATHSVGAFYDPDFSITAPDPNSSLTSVGGGAPDCGPYEIDNSFDPELGVNTGPGGVSLLLDWTGQALPEGGDSNESGNANDLPASCGDLAAKFEMSSPLNDEGENGFDIPWQPGTDTIRFTFSGFEPGAASQVLMGTSISQTATATGQDDGSMGCFQDSAETCTDTYTNLSETLTLTKICTGTVTQEQYGVEGACGSGPAPPPAGKAPSGTRISTSTISSNHHSASFAFGATNATGFRCALTALPEKGHAALKLRYSACKSPKSYSNLKAGKYDFVVRGVNAAGNDPHPASKRFTVG